MISAQYILTVTCSDTTGIVAAIAGFLAEQGAFIIESQQFGDPATNRFFMRITFRAGRDDMPDMETLAARFAHIGKHFAMDWHIHDAAKPPRVAIMVSRLGHCLNDLLHRWHTGRLAIDIPAVISNHEAMRSLVEWHGIPFYHVPMTAGTKPAREAEIRDLVAGLNTDLVVLARYMQILTRETCTAWSGRCINVHHSFLPSFRGA
ncbi:MAG: formyltetrahydrofolate deformylase, partial [Pseudomonadota bacterium]|nr:formyltetrahydrofolate deformylase [Pseudomonadota bacterium]